MTPVFILNNKGQSTLLTSFFYIVVVCAVIIGFVAFQNTILNIDYSMDIKVMRIDLAQDVKRVLFKCYGYPIPLNISTYECPIPMGDGDITIKGIKLEQLEFGICDAEIMRDQVPIDFDQSIIYTVPIFNNHTYCPGSLTIYI